MELLQAGVDTYLHAHLTLKEAALAKLEPYERGKRTRFRPSHDRATERLTGRFTAALQVPEVKAKFAALGLLPVGTCGADFGAYLRKQYEEYGRLIRELNIKGE